MASYDGTIKIMTAVDPLGIRKGLSDITSSITGLSRTISSASSGMFSGLQSGFASTARGANSLNSALTKIAATIATVVSAKALIDFARDSIELGSDLIEMENVTNTVFGSMAGAVDAWAKNASRTAGQTEKQAKNYIGTLGAMAKAFGYGTEEAYAMSTTLTQLTGDVASFYNLDQDEAFNKMKAVFTGETESLKSLGVVMTQAALDEFALANGFGKVTAKMTEAEKVALRYRFIQEKLSAASGDFVRTQDSWANQMKQLKLNIQEIMSNLGQGLINVLLPFVKAINMLLGRLGTLANSFKSFSELLTGKKSSGPTGSAQAGLQELTGNLDDSTDATIKYSDATKDAAKANKKYLSSLDEMNRWQSEATPEEPGTGLGDALSWLGDVDYGNLAQGETAIDRFSAALQRLADAVKKGDWEKIGDTIMNALSNMIEKIDWNKIYEKAESFGTGLASFLNGLIDPRLFWDLGRTIANAINTALTAANAFAVTFDFTNLGKSLAMGLISFLTNIQWDTLLSAATNWAKGIADALNGFLKPSTFKTVGSTIAKLLNTAVTAAFTLGSELHWEDIGTGIAAGINEAIDEFDFDKVAETINVWAEGFLGMITKAISGVDWFKFGLKIRNALLKVKWGVLLRRVARLIWTVLSGALKTLAGLFFDTDSVTNPISDAFNGIHDTLDKFKTQVDWDAIANSIKSIAESLTPFVEGIGEGFLNFFKTLFDFGVDFFQTLSEDLPGIAEAISSLDPDILKTIGNVIGAIVAAGLTVTLGTTLFNVFSGMGQGISTLLTFIGSHPYAAIIAGIIALVSLLASSDIPGMKEGIDALKNALKPFVKGFGEGFFGFFQGIADIGQAVWNFIVETIGPWLSDHLPGIAEAINKIDGDNMEAIGRALGVIAAIKVTTSTISGIGKLLGMLGGAGGGAAATTVLGGGGAATGSGGGIFGALGAGLASLGATVSHWIPPIAAGIATFELTTYNAGGSFGNAADLVNGFGDAVELLGDKYDENTMSSLNSELEKLNDLDLNSDSATAGAIDIIATALFNAGISAVDVKNTFTSMGISATSDLATVATVLGNLEEQEGRVASSAQNAHLGISSIGEGLDNELVQSLSSFLSDTDNTLGVLPGKLDVINNLLQNTSSWADPTNSAKNLWSIAQSLHSAGITADDVKGKISGLGSAELVILLKNLEDGVVRLGDVSWDYSDAMDSAGEATAAAGSAADTTAEQLGNMETKARGIKRASTYVQSAAEDADNLSEAQDNVDTSAGNASAGIGSFLKGIIGKMISFLTIKGFFTSIGDASDDTKEKTDLLKNKINTAFKKIATHAGDAKDSVEPDMESIGSSIEGVSDSVDTTVTTVEDQGDNLSQWVNGWADEMAAEVRDDGVNITEGLASGLEDETAKNGLLNTLKDVFGMPDDEIVAMYGISSPSRVMYDYGQYMVQGLADGIQSMRNYLYNAFSDVLSSLPNAITSLQHDLAWRLNSMIEAAESTQHSIADALSFHITLDDKTAQLTGWSEVWLNVPHRYSNYRVPYLATGAVIPPNSPFLAMMGDQKSGTNIEAPLSTIKQAVIEALGEQKRGGSYEFVAQLNRRTIFDEVIEEAKMRQMQSGSNPFDLA